VAEYAKIAKVGSEGVLAMLSDSTNSFKSGHSKSETVIGNNLLDIVEGAKGRVIVSTFSSLVTRILQLIETAIVTNRKVAIAGRSMENVIEICIRLGYLKRTRNLFIKTSELDKYSDNRLLILATGAQGEDMAALARIGRGEHRDIKIKKGDSVILSASIIPGNDMLVQGLIDELSELGAIVFHQAEEMTLHSSGHGYQEDQKIMLNLAKPKFFIPVHGYPSFLHKHAQTAVTVGMQEKDIIISKRGDIISLTKTSWRKEGKVKATPVLVSGSGVGDIGNLVLEEREQLANYGVVVIAIQIDWNAKRIIGKPHIVSRGFIYVKDNLDMITRIENETEKVISELMQKDVKEVKQLKDEIIVRVDKILFAETEREPMILPIIIY
jgi:ribonuclease J